MTIMSGDIASMLRTVSRSVSPFVTLDVATAMLSVSALRRFSATSNDVRVRVLGSKNRFTTVRPRSVGTFLIGRAAISCHRFGGVEDQRDLVGLEAGDAEQVTGSQVRGGIDDAAWSSVRSSAPSISTSSTPSISCSRTCTLCFERRGQVLADVVGLDRQLAVAAVHEHDQLDRARPAEVDQRVQRGADRPAGVQHVVHQQDPPVVDRKRNLGAAHDRLRPDGMAHQIVAVERDVERAGRHFVAVDLRQAARNPPRERHAAGADADQRELARCRGSVSRISCAMRVSARDMRSASIT